MRQLKLVVIALLTLLLLPAPTALAAPTSAAITLAAPTGPFPTGTVRLHLRDEHRVDPLDPQGRPRELMVQLWYPSRRAGDPAPYAPPAESAALQAFYGVPEGAFDAITHSRLGAPVLPGRHPVVFFHHGLCAVRTDTTALDEQLASLGFVVVALGNTHESPLVAFPGGRNEVTSDPAFCTAGGDPFGAGAAILQRLLDVRVADTRYVLDQLERVNRGVNPDADHTPLPRGLAGSLETHRVGMFGHSFGGATTAGTLAADPRFVAGVNFDGFIIGPTAQQGLAKPFLTLGSSWHDTTNDRSWADFLPRLTGWHRWFRVDDAGHYRFIDFGGSVRKWGLEEQIKPRRPDVWAMNFGDIDDALSQQITIRLTSAFFRHFLCGAPTPILDDPHRVFPLVENRT